MGKIKLGLFSVVVLCVASLVGLLIYQSVWLKEVIGLAGEQYDHRAITALNSVSQEYSMHKALDTCFNNTSLVRPVDAKKDSLLLDSLFSVYIKANHLSSKYEYSLVKLSNSKTSDSLAVDKKRYVVPLVAKDGGENHQLCLYFPHRVSFILRESWYWLGGYILFFAVIIFGLVFLIKTILRQKHLAEEQADFVRSMIHELKTPVATIGMSSKVLKKAGITVTDFEKLRNYAGIVDEENSRIQAHVESLLQMLTVNKRSLSLRKELVDVNNTIQVAVEGFSVATMSQSVSFILKLDEELPQILADKMHVRAVIDNIIDNAIKYSSNDKTIEVVTEQTKKNVIIIIKDNGRGIARKDIKRVFHKFYRVSSEKKRGVTGFGLGLYYVKQVVAAHDGRIYVKSKLNKGTQIGVLFPIE